MNARLCCALAWLAVLAAPSLATATSFRLPLNDCDTPTQCVDDNKCYVTAYFDHAGKDWNCGTEQYDGHEGTDFGVQNTVGVRPVVAGATGTVLETNDGCGTGFWGNTCGGGYGNYVKLQHLDGKVTIYGHMAAGTLKVSQGNSVACGQELGRAGSSGNSTGPHLHFEVIDPTYGIDDPYKGGCGGPLTYWVSQGGYCLLPSTTCEGGCTANCSGKQCGPDGCGSICGSCTGTTYCSEAGTCTSTPSDDSQSVGETIPDGTHFKPGATFTKSWTLKNIGTTTWTKAGGYSLAYQREAQFGAATRTWLSDTDSIAPNGTKTWSVPMTAPTVPGTYRGYWSVDRNGAGFGASVWCEIIVDPAEVDAATMLDETLEDGTVFIGGTTVTKTWTMMNAGTSTWKKADGFQWKFLHGDLMNHVGYVDLGTSEAVAPGKTKVWTVTFTAPVAPGTYRGYWGMTHNGATFGPTNLWIEISVTAPTPADKDGDDHISIATGGDDCNDNDPNIHPGMQEKCDNKDNDCNGQTDDGVTRDCVALGCLGTQTCTKGVWGACSATGPSQELCNNVDDDCDGFTDERATCPSGYGCIDHQCQALPDAGLPRVDASAPGPDAARPDSGCPSLACTSPDGCKSGMLSCADLTSCVNLKIMADGVACPGGACKSGRCVACPAGEDCTYGDGCLVGKYDCTTGTPVCSDLAAVYDFTPCSSGWCKGGVCRSIPDAGPMDAATPPRDASVFRPDAAAPHYHDAGPVGHPAPTGCGCQSGSGAFSSVILSALALLLARLRRP